jgi:uncharacterized DUF497 family protein
MEIDFDPEKDAANIARRGISLAEAEPFLKGFTVAFEDTRRDYGETRIIALGEINGLEFVCVYTLRRGGARVISLRRANRKERNVYRNAKDTPA